MAGGAEEFYDIKVKPVAEGWQMGEIWDCRLHRNTTMREVMEHIEEHWGIPWNRQYFRLQNGKGLPLARESWSFRRLGIGNGYTIQVEPTLYRSWWWHPLEFYERKLIEQIKQALKESPTGRMVIEELKDQVDHPPPIVTSLKVLLRKYPEELLLFHDLTQDKLWVQEPMYRYQLPIHTSFPVQMGYVPVITTPMDPGSNKFDFDALKDIDTDLKRVEVDFDVPDVTYEITIMGCSELMLLAERGHKNHAFVCVYFMGKLIGKTYVIRNSRFPVWRDQTFSFAISASVEVFSCNLRFEVWDSDGKIMDDGGFPYTQFLGFAELSGQELIDLICNRKQTICDLPLKFRAKSLNVNNILKFQYETKQTTVDYSKISGSLIIKGGKKGMEVNVQLAYSLIELPDPRSRPLTVVVWNGEDLGQSFPDRMEAFNPIFEEVFRIPRLGMNQTLATSSLEVQIWGTDPENEEIRGDFMGSIQLKEQKLVELMSGYAPFASRYKKDLSQSKTVAFKHRKKPVRGSVSIQLGPSGLFYRKAIAIEVEVVAALKIAKFPFVYYTVDWNFKRIFKSGPITVISTKIGEKQSTQAAAINEKFRLELDYGATDASDSNLLIMLHEYNKLAGNEAEFLGQVQLTGEELCELLSKPFKKTAEFDLENHPTIDGTRQRMIRGQMKLRGGRLGLNARHERTLIVDSCFDLVDLTAKKDIPTLNCPVVVILWGGKEVGQTRKVMNHTFINSPQWEEEVFFVPLPVYVSPAILGDDDNAGGGGGGGFFGNLFKKMFKKKGGGGGGSATASAPPNVADAKDSNVENATEKKEGADDIEETGSLVEGSVEGSLEGSVTKSLDGAKSDEGSKAGDKNGDKKSGDKNPGAKKDDKKAGDKKDDKKAAEKKKSRKKGKEDDVLAPEDDPTVSFTLDGCSLDVEVWDYVQNPETKEWTQNLFLGGFHVNNENLQELLGSQEPCTKTFDLQTNNFKYPGKGKVNPQAKCTLSSCGLKYDTPYTYWDDLQKGHLEESAARAEAKRLALGREAELVRVQKEIAWKLANPDPDPEPEVVMIGEGGENTEVSGAEDREVSGDSGGSGEGEGENEEVRDENSPSNADDGGGPDVGAEHQVDEGGGGGGEGAAADDNAAPVEEDEVGGEVDNS